MKQEFLFLLKDKAAWLWISIAFFSAMIAVFLGLNEVQHQRHALDELKQLDRVERTLALNTQSDWGSAAYYTFHLTYDPPSDFAFAALGARDISPWKHRIRMLALEGQIYETDADNPDFALIGRFDYAFVTALLAPLLVILLLYNLRPGERAAGRFNLIETNAGRGMRIWLSRSLLRLIALNLSLLIPLWIGGIIEGTSVIKLFTASCILGLYVLLWGIGVYIIAKPHRSGSASLTYLTGIWLFVSAILPALLVTGVNSAVSLPKGGDIILTQREAVNDAWDLPKDDTMTPFLARHPEWSNDSKIEKPFEWKWYYAFQQVGDQTAEPLSQAYREGRATRDNLMSTLSLISPATWMQRKFEAMAQTDAQASFDYDAHIRKFHAELRDWYYPKLFQNEEFNIENAKQNLPIFEAD